MFGLYVEKLEEMEENSEYAKSTPKVLNWSNKGGEYLP